MNGGYMGQAFLEQVEEVLGGEVAASTLTAYVTDTRGLLRWLGLSESAGAQEVPPALAARGGLAAYLQHLDQRYARTTVDRKRWSLGRVLPALLGAAAPEVPRRKRATPSPRAEGPKGEVAVPGEETRREGWRARLVLVLEPRSSGRGVADLHAAISYRVPGTGRVVRGATADRCVSRAYLGGIWEEVFGLAADVERYGSRLVEVQVSADPAVSQWAVGAVEVFAAVLAFEFGAEEPAEGNGQGRFDF